MSYTSDSEEYEEEDYDFTEEDYEHNYNLAVERLDIMLEEIKESNNPWLLSTCTITGFYDFIETGEIYSTKVYSQKELKAPEPINIDFNDIKPAEWTYFKKGGIITLENKEEKEYKKRLQEQKNKTKKEANKYNWTMSREERGLPLKNKIRPEKPKPKPKPRKFKVNKSYSCKM